MSARHSPFLTGVWALNRFLRHLVPSTPAPPPPRLTCTTGLEALTALEVLSLADNYISKLEGLGDLGRLRDLNLARNDLVTVGGVLGRCRELSTLNLAANKLSSIQASGL